MRLYIDPGTGSMLFTVLIGVVGALIYAVRVFFTKFKCRTGGKAEVNADQLPFVIFSDDKRYWNIFAPVLLELGKRGKDVVYLTSSEDDPALHCGYKNVKAENIGSGNRCFAKLNHLNAMILLSTTPGLEVYQWKRSKQVRCYVHIFHAANDVTLYRSFGIDYYDALLVSGEYQIDQIRRMENLRKLPSKEITLIGIPYMDVLARRYAEVGPAPEHPRTVLLAPSWGKSALFGVYGGRILEILLKTGYHIIVRPHPQSFQSEKELLDGLMRDYPASDQLEWNRDLDNFEVLRRSDVLISDFSGVIFDYTLIFDKPVIYTDPNFDLSPYDAWWLKEPLWTASALPRIGALLTEENLQELKKLIDTCITDPRFAEGRKAVKAETWAFPGEGAVRAAEYLIQKFDALQAEKD